MNQQHYHHQLHVLKPPPALGPLVSRRSPSYVTRSSVGLSSSPADLTPSRSRPHDSNRYFTEGTLTSSPLSAIGSKSRASSQRLSPASRTELRLPLAAPTPTPRQSQSPSPEVAPRAIPKFTPGCNILVHEWREDECIATYRCGDMLGQGGFAKVFDFIEVRTKERFACKIVEKEKLKAESTRSKFFAEVEIHQRLKHPNILNFIRYFDDENYYYLLLERCCRYSMMDLHMSRGVFTVPEIQHIMAQLLVAVEFLHANLVIHRDLKLGNLMIDPFGNIKVGDFGFATQLQSPEELKLTMCGTPNYIAPEVLKPEDPSVPSPGYSFGADVWSMGVILYTLAVGKPPFETKDVNTTYGLIRKCDYQFPAGSLTVPPVPIPEGVRSMVSEMLCLNPRDRSSISELLQHPFLATAPAVAPPGLQFLDAEISPPFRTPRCHSRHVLAPLRGASGSGNTRSASSPHARSSHREAHAMEPQHHLTMLPQPNEILCGGRVIEMSFFPKYGWYYRIAQFDGRLFSAVTLNDYTKVLLDEDTSQIWYYSRGRGDDRQRDREYYFDNPSAANECAQSPKGVEMGMAKKILILTFLKSQIEGKDDPNFQSIATASASISRKRPSADELISSRCAPPVMAKNFYSFDSFYSLPSSVCLRATTIRLSSNAHQHVLNVFACGLDESVVLTGYGPCIAPWNVDFTCLDGIVEVIFASQVNGRCVRVDCLLEALIEVDRLGASLSADTVCIPSWLCSAMLAMVRVRN